MKSIQTLGHSQNLHLIAGKVALPRFSAATCLRSILGLCVLLTLTPAAKAAAPDLTAAGVIAALKSTPTYSNRPYSETYNLGPTGLRGWIYIDGNNSGQQGLITAPSRQILITVASAPGSAVLAVDDVILGAMAANSGVVPLFSSDCRKAFGVAIGEAEKTSAGTLRVKRWRAGNVTDENIAMTIMGDYTATAPFACPKSGLVLANARTKLVSQLLADPNFLASNYGGAIDALALLASVAPGDANYAAVQTRLQSYARALAPANLNLTGCNPWSWGYFGIFLSEYYLRSVADGTPDTSVLHGINEYALGLAKGQSRYGTFGHGGSLLKTDGSLHGTIPPYGPVNAAGIPANIAIVMGKKTLAAAGLAIDPEYDPAIQRAVDFFGFYVNKGPIPYGEHEPYLDSSSSGHAPNGKDAMCAVLFGLQDNRPVQAEYFTRITTAGCTGREYGHTGQGFSYLWGALGANMGGSAAVTEYLKNVRWHLDLERRTDGSFVYDGQEQYGGGKTADGTYLGACGYYAVRPTSSYILTYAVALQRLYITGKKDAGATDYTLSATKVAAAIAAASFKQDCTAYTTTQLIAVLNDYDPVVRNDAAKELGARTLSTTEVNTLITMAGASDVNGRMGACQTLGILKTPGALTLLGQRLSDSDIWVRGIAAKALKNYGSAASGQVTPMLTAFTANATDPEVIVWNDPVQIANGFLSNAIVDANLSASTSSASKSLLYPALRAALKQPDSLPRLIASNYTYNYLTLADVQALTPDLFAVATTEAQADTMWHGEARASGISTLAKFKIAEAIPIALAMQTEQNGYGWGSHHYRIAAFNALSAYGDSARFTLPALRDLSLAWAKNSTEYPSLLNAISSIDAAITSPAGIFNALAVATPQVVVTTGAKAITLTGSSCRGTALTFYNVTPPAHGTLTGTAPNLIYTPAAGYTGTDRFTFQTNDTLTTSELGTVSIIVGTAGTGVKGEYYDNSAFTNLKLTRTDPQVNFDWGIGAPAATVGSDTFSVRWSCQLLVPETGSYTFSTLNSDGVRLYINGILLLDDYVDQLTGWKDGTPISLTAGQRVELQMEYYENTGSAVAKLKWTGPSLAGLNGLPIAQEWLFDGTGVTNRIPFAHSQSFAMIQNTAQAVTLTGSGANLTPLTYSIITQPAHGTLTGSGANVTYTPAANYSGSDSFTFLVNNGVSNSAPATVSFGVWAGQPTAYFWANPVAGNWSGATEWIDSLGAPVTPAATGEAFYTLNFNQAGSYTTTHDLNNNFVFNQLNAAGAVTLSGTNALSLTANGNILPQINQNSSSTVSFGTPIRLAAITQFAGTGNGEVEFSEVVSGAGGIIKDSMGSLQLYGLTPNTFSGGIVVNKGTLYLGTYINGISPPCVNPAGTGPVTLNPGATIQFDRVIASNALIANGGTLFSPNGWGATWSGAITLNGTLTVNAPYTLNCSGAIGGAGGFIKTGNNTLLLTGSNNSTGNNSVVAGIMQCNSAAALGTGALNITSGGKVNLNFTGTRVIAALSYDGGTPLAPGTYGSVASPATNKSDTYFSGNGTITILPASTTALALTSGSTPSNFGVPLTFRATVTGTSPTGNVGFYAGSTLLGSSALNGSFQASFTTSSLTVGAYEITAQYVGNATHAASSSAALAIEITTQSAPPPVNLYATPGNNRVNLTWTISAAATSYNVMRSLANGGPYTTLGSSSAASYSDLTATNGTTYFYRVSAVNGVGESANSSIVSATPSVPLPAKDILSFVFPGLPAVDISGANITVTVPYATPITALAPTYTVSSGASGNPVSGTARDFTSPQSYTITGSDSTTQTYTVAISMSDAPAPLTYTFDDATLQGWNNRVWNGSAWIDLAANATTYAGSLLPASANNGLFVPGNGAVWVSGSTDFHLNTLWLRSPQFLLNGTGNLTVQLAKGIANTAAPANDLAVPSAAVSGGGWKGVALRRVSDGVFVLTKARTGSSGDDFRTVTFTQSELATLNQNAAYSLELINSDRGSWGWLTMDNVSIPGRLPATNLTAVATTTSLVSSLNPAAPGVSVTFTASVAGGSPAGNVTFFDGATALGSSVLNGSFQATFSLTNLAIGTHLITAQYGGSSIHAASTSSALNQQIALSPYAAWADGGAQGLTAGVNDSPAADPDGDGISNLMEFALGGAPMVSSPGILPVLANVGGTWFFDYNRSDLSQAGTTQVVEYGSNLTGWTPILIPAATSSDVVITPGSPADHVRVTLPATGSQGFVRLKVGQ